MILFEHVTKQYANQDRPALEDLSLEIDKGEFVFLVGPSGSGKSTFLRLVLREERPTKGAVWVAGKELNRLSNWKIPALRRQIGTVFQDFRLLPNKTVAENIAFALEVIGKPSSHIRKVVPEVLEVVGLEGKEQRLPSELSGGEQQRVAIARALVNSPDMIIADEPTGNLDPARSLEIMLLFQKINELGTTVLLVTHEKELVNAFSKRVVSLSDGCLISDGMDGYYGYES